MVSDLEGTTSVEMELAMLLVIPSRASDFELRLISSRTLTSYPRDPYQPFQWSQKTGQLGRFR